MANNPFIFDGALSGATGAINERWLTNTDPNSYIGIRNLLVAFANAVDALIPASGGITSADGTLIQNICNGVLSQRFLTTETNVQSLAQAIVALYQTIRAQLIPLPYPSSDTLSTVKYVDRTTTLPTANQTGSIISPFATIVQAIAALPSGGTIMVVPGDYTSEGALVFSANDWTLSSFDAHPNYVYGAGGPKSVSVGAISGPVSINMVGIVATSTVTTSAGLTADSCFFTGAINAGFMDAFDCRLLAGAIMNIAIGMSLTDCRIDAGVVNCSVAGISRFVDCELNTSFAFTSVATGTIIICGRTNYFLQAIAGTITGANLTVQATPGQNIRQPTTIVATGAQGTVDITSLESGGVLIYQPSANFNVDGFTAKPPGFWFDIFIDSTNLSFVGTLNQEVGATATTRIRNPNNQPYPMVAGQMTRVRYQLNRWRIGNPPSPSTQAVISVAVPALAAGVLGYLDVSLVGSAIAGPLANSQVIASPQADLAAAGAANGFYIGGRMSATNIFRMAFVGTLAGGNFNFTFTRL